MYPITLTVAAESLKLRISLGSHRFRSTAFSFSISLRPLSIRGRTRNEGEKNERGGRNWVEFIAMEKRRSVEAASGENAKGRVKKLLLLLSQKRAEMGLRCDRAN